MLHNLMILRRFRIFIFYFLIYHHTVRIFNYNFFMILYLIYSFNLL
jgi:hypothetical protein